MLQLQSVTSIPSSEWYDNERSEFSEYDVRDLEKNFPNMVGIYDYRQGSYSGSGYLIGLSEDKWYAIPLGHCSCYWPLEDCHRSIAYSKEDITTLVEKLWDSDLSEEVRQEFLTFIRNH